MAPEVLAENVMYTTASDIFSFGHLSLYTILQQFPVPTAPTSIDHNNPGVVVGHSEVQRRSQYIQQLSQLLGSATHPVVQVITQCIQNVPVQRPSARQVLHELEDEWMEIEGLHEQTKLELMVTTKFLTTQSSELEVVIDKYSC